MPPPVKRKRRPKSFWERTVSVRFLLGSHVAVWVLAAVIYFAASPNRPWWKGTGDASPPAGITKPDPSRHPSPRPTAAQPSPDNSLAQYLEQAEREAPDFFEEEDEPRKPGGPVVALIIDDCGGSLDGASPFLDLRFPVTLAVLPHLPHSKEVALACSRNGKEAILHLPLEPLEMERHPPGPGVLLIRMDPSEQEETLMEDLASVPGTRGVNSHMGSAFTQDPQAMTILLRLLKGKGLFFIDSFTIPTSLGVELARKMGLPTARRRVFLDNVDEREAILGQVKKLREEVLKRGRAIGIGHCRPLTAEVLREEVSSWGREGISVVTASRYLGLKGS